MSAYLADPIRGVHKLTNDGYYVKDFGVKRFDEQPISITVNSDHMFFLDVRKGRIKRYDLKTNKSIIMNIRSRHLESLESLEPFGFIKTVRGELFTILLFPDNKSYLQQYSNDGALINDWLIGEGGFTFDAYDAEDKFILVVSDGVKISKYYS